MCLRSISIFLLFCHCISSDSSVKEIHDTYSLHPVQINDFYNAPEKIQHNHIVEPSTNTEVNIEETIKEVQQLIQSNPNLPKLTRGEIVDIIENITKTDKNAINTREEGKRAIMLVMPFTAGSAQDDIKELYTRTPVTHYIGGGGVSEQQIVQKEANKNRRRPTFPPIINLPPEEMHNLYNLPAETTKAHANSENANTPADIVGEFKPLPDVKIQTSPLLSTYTTSTTTTVAPFIQIRQKPLRKSPKPQTKHPNHKYPDDNNSQSGIHIIKPPQLAPHDNKYSAPFTMSLTKLQTSTEINKILMNTNENTKSSTTEKNFIDDMPIPEDYKNVVKDLNLLIHTDTYKDEKPKVEIFPTLDIDPAKYHVVSTTDMPDISNVAENLSPDMKDLLMNFGLLADPNKKPSETFTESVYYNQNAEIQPGSYVNFKPLPDTAPARNDMEEFLSRFGLGRSSFRSQKSISVNKPAKELGKNSEVNMDIIPKDMRGVIKDIGFVTTDLKEVESLNQISEQPKHIFDPTNQNTTEDELKKINKLLDMIKDLGKLNGTVTKDSLKDVDVDTLKQLIGDFNGHKFVPLNEQDAPNPLNYDITEEKAGVKRQEETTTETTIDTTIHAEKLEGPSFLDLESSFGKLPDITTTPESPSTTPKTGFFYLFDWNSFLELDNQLGRKVNLRFQPHAGDPKAFDNITVP